MTIGVGRLIGKTGRGLSMAGSNKAVLGGIALGGVGLGMANTAAPAARDAAFDFAMGDPNADVAFTGRKLDSRFLVGNAMGGVLGNGIAATSDDFYTFHKTAPPPINLIGNNERGAVGLGIGAGVGGAIGGIRGKGKGALIGAGIGGFLGGTAGLGSVGSAPYVTGGGAIAGAIAAGTIGFRKGPIKGIIGAALGTVGGAAAGATVAGGMIAGSLAPGALPTMSVVRNNEQFYSQSPYARTRNSSLSTMGQTNAVGDIVLGMHNSRRGY